MKSGSRTAGTGSPELGAWTGGVNSMRAPFALPEDQLQWMQNATNRGGIVQTRPGRALRLIVPGSNAQGFANMRVDKTVTSDGAQVKLAIDYQVVAASGRVFAVPFNPDGSIDQPIDWTLYQLNVAFDPDAPMVIMKVCRRNILTKKLNA